MSMTTSFRDAPIKRKLLLIGLLTSGLALLFVSLILTARGWAEWRERTIYDMTTYADIIGANAASAMLFDDQNAATETLSALSANPNIVDAVIYDKGGRAFARFMAPQHSPGAFNPSIKPGSHLFNINQLVVTEPVRFKGELVGSIYLESDLRGFYADILRDTVLTFIAALGVFLASIFLFARLQKAIVGPILDLSNKMREVSAGQDYSVRVAVRGKDEVGMLARTFNDMLAQVQSRDAELEQYRKHLEGEVSLRTARLTEAQRIAHLGNWEWDIASNKLDWSYEIYRIFGLAQQFGITFETFLQAVHPEDRQFVDAKVREALEQNRPYSIDHRILLPGGAVRHVHEQAEVSRGEDGRPVKMWGTVQDITEQKRAEKDLRLFKELLEESNDAIFINDAETSRILDVNERTLKSLGYAREELLGMRVTDIEATLPEKFSWEEHMKKLDAAGFMLLEGWHRRKDGAVFPVEVSVRNIQAEGKKFNLAIVRDITERKRSEEIMERLRRDLEMVLESAGEGVCTIDINGNHTLVNPAAARMFGYEVEEMAGRHSHSLLHYARADGAPYPEEECPLSATLRDGMSRRIDSEVFWRKDGSSFPAEYVSTAILQDGIITGAVSVFRDITERKLAEEKIRESEARYRGIFEYADDIIYLLAPDGTFNSLSPSFERLTGWQPDEWVGKPFAPIVHPDDLPHALEVFQKVLSGQSTPSFELRIARKSGVYFDSELNIVPVSPGGKIAAIGIARDITERKQVEEKIRKLNEELEIKVQERTRQLLDAQEELVRKEKLAVLGQVAGSVGHELRNPLGVMNNAVYFLQTVLSDADETTKEYLNIIKDEIAGSERIVSDLLDAVRTKPPHPEMTEVAELIGQTLRKCSVPSSVTVKLDIPATLPPLRVDAQQVHQVFRNLISNGIEAMTEGGLLEISAVENKPDGTITVSVRDSGSGITPEALPKLFQPLFTTKARGIGLGLVVVKNLTQANGGTVKVESEAGKGTVFSITLPAADETGVLI